jgi:hypothetical protein
MNVCRARLRVTMGTNFFNQGRTAEIADVYYTCEAVP